MGVIQRHIQIQQRKKRVSISLATIAAAAVALAFLLSASGASASGLHSTRQLGGEVTEEEGGVWKSSTPSKSVEPEQVATQRRLNGPGSAPPLCTGKCGSCRPCKPVRVAIQPGVSTPLDYYPVAWRCKCGNKVFMPY